MNNTFNPPTITISQTRYNELIKTEEKLKFITNALNTLSYWDINNIRAIFELEEKKGTTV